MNSRYLIKYLIIGLVILGYWPQIISQEIAYKVEKDILYRSNPSDDYARSRCVLDLYYPENLDDFVTLVWFHGGGLTAGNKFIPVGFLQKGFAVVAVNYRLYPRVEAPIYIEDAAASVAWVFNNIEKFGGDRDKIIVSGHSAGGYLTSMVGLDSSYLSPHNIHPNEIAALIPYSGHTITHFTIRKERGIDGKIAVIDKMAPLFHVREDAPPMIMITGDRDLELLGRYEETAYFVRMMKEVGHQKTILYELEGFNHGEMAIPAHQIVLKYIKDNFSEN